MNQKIRSNKIQGTIYKEGTKGFKRILILTYIEFYKN